jgi:tetratricopeptide (TPR) repeat protein
LELDDGLAEAHASLGLLRSDADWDWHGAEREYRRAIELNPNYATAHQWYSILLGATLGRVKEGIAEAEKALELDPLSAIINLNIGEGYLATGNLDLAEKFIGRSLELEPGFPGGLSGLAMFAVEKGSYREAVDVLEKAQNLFPTLRKKLRVAIASVYAKSGDLERARKVFEDNAGVAGRDYVTSVDLAYYFAATGDRDKAFERLEEAFEGHDPELCTIGANLWLRELFSDPRFDAFLRKMKIR